MTNIIAFDTYLPRIVRGYIGLDEQEELGNEFRPVQIGEEGRGRCFDPKKYKFRIGNFIKEAKLDSPSQVIDVSEQDIVDLVDFLWGKVPPPEAGYRGDWLYELAHCTQGYDPDRIHQSALIMMYTKKREFLNCLMYELVKRDIPHTLYLE